MKDETSGGGLSNEELNKIADELAKKLQGVMWPMKKEPLDDSCNERHACIWYDCDDGFTCSRDFSCKFDFDCNDGFACTNQEQFECRTYFSDTAARVVKVKD